MYWGGAKIERLGASLVKPFKKELIDCAAYTLRMGDECYLTREPGQRSGSTSPSQLSPATSGKNLGEGFRIEPGQFAYLLTLETLSIPENVLAFISLKATFKWKGLINVSGFHVDPGYKGRLVYAVYNAGSSDITVRHGEPLFLIWFADLAESSRAHAYKKAGLTQIDSKFMGQASGDVRSLPELAKKVESLNGLVIAFGIASGVVLAFLSLIVGVFAYMNWEAATARAQAPSVEAPMVETKVPVSQGDAPAPASPRTDDAASTLGPRPIQTAPTEQPAQ